jgi:hypothetical protein
VVRIYLFFCGLNFVTGLAHLVFGALNFSRVVFGAECKLICVGFYPGYFFDKKKCG